MKNGPGPGTGARFERAVEIMERLRAPGGCPWDREQTFDTIKPFTLEETYEVLEAIDNRDWNELTGELGDLLLQVLFYSEMAREAGHFTVDDVLDRLAAKLVGRHPHVFGDVKAETSGDVLRNWEALKAKERAASGSATAESAVSILDGVSQKMPALMEALKLSTRAAQVGFEWPKFAGLLEKMEEEIAELCSELRGPGPVAPPHGGVAGASGQPMPEVQRARLEDEAGDLLFTAVNIARYLRLDPESALRKSNRKFRRRFAQVEVALRQAGSNFEQASPEELEALWQQAKITTSAAGGRELAPGDERP